MFRLPCQPSYSGRFACLGSHSSLVIWPPKSATQHFQPCRCIASSAMNCVGQRRKLSAGHDAAWYLGGIRISQRSPYRHTAAVCLGHLQIGPLGHVCIPPTVLCATLLCVVPLWFFPCFRWHVQLGEVRWPYLTCLIRTATAWSPDGIFIQWSGGATTEDNDADDVFWNLLIRRVNEYELKPDFFALISSFGRVEVQESPCNSFSANRFLSLLCSRCIMFWCELQRFVLRRLSVSAFFRFLGWCEVPRHAKETLRNTSKPAHPWHKAGLSGNVVLQEFSLWFLIWFLGWTAPESASGLDQQLQSVNMYASIKDMTSFQEHPKSSFVAKCLSSIHNVCKLDGSTYPGPLLRWKGPCEGWLLASCDLRFLVCFFFPDPSIFPHLVCGRVWLMALWQRWSIIHHQGGWHEYALWDKFLSATRHKLDSYSFRSIIFDKFERNDFALKHTCQTCKTYWVIW